MSRPAAGTPTGVSVTGADGLGLDRVRSRQGVKWARYGPDVLAAWVADMDFDPPPDVVAVLREMLDLGDLGYRVTAGEVEAAYASWQERRHGWRPDVERVRVFSSALHALETVLWLTTEPGDGVVVFTPIYHPFLHAIRDSGRRRVDVPLDPDGWRLDPERLAAEVDDTTRLVLFCQPHNPTGRIYDEGEVRALADVVERHDLLVVSDELWGDLCWDAAHVPLALADERFHGRLVTLGSASKSFNLAGLRCGVAHVDHQPIHDLAATMPSHLFGGVSTLGAVGTTAAWERAEPWLDAARIELRDRRDQLARRVSDELPEVGFDAPEATYLAWLDLGATGLGPSPADRLLADHGLALSPGAQFGEQAGSYARLNFATSEQILDEVIDRLVAAVRGDGRSVS